MTSMTLSVERDVTDRAASYFKEPIGDFVAVGRLYHQFYLGLLLALASRAGTARGAEVVFRAFRRQQTAKFLRGLEKLGLRALPPAVACAQYHYLSNVLGGAKVEWIPETDRKSWIRFLPPRWMFDGAVVCGIPSEMSRATMRGWHANNGVLLGNLRLGFVCTSLTTDAGPGLIGYYIEGDRDLAPDERLRFAPGEQPPGPPRKLPVVDWSEERRAKVRRNYSMEYVRSTVLAMCEVLGPAEAGHIGRVSGRQIGMQFHDALCEELNHSTDSHDAVTSYAALLVRLAQAHGDDAEWEQSSDGSTAHVRQRTWRFAEGLTLPPEGFEAWNGLWEGLAAVHGDRLGIRILPTRRIDHGDKFIEWRLRAAT